MSVANVLAFTVTLVIYLRPVICACAHVAREQISRDHSMSQSLILHSGSRPNGKELETGTECTCGDDMPQLLAQLLFSSFLSVFFILSKSVFYLLFDPRASVAADYPAQWKRLSEGGDEVQLPPPNPEFYWHVSLTLPARDL